MKKRRWEIYTTTEIEITSQEQYKAQWGNYYPETFPFPPSEETPHGVETTERIATRYFDENMTAPEVWEQIKSEYPPNAHLFWTFTNEDEYGDDVTIEGKYPSEDYKPYDEYDKVLVLAHATPKGYVLVGEI